MNIISLRLFDFVSLVNMINMLKIIQQDKLFMQITDLWMIYKDAYRFI